MRVTWSAGTADILLALVLLQGRSCSCPLAAVIPLFALLCSDIPCFVVLLPLCCPQGRVLLRSPAGPWAAVLGMA